jgi:hypothetical protein
MHKLTPSTLTNLTFHHETAKVGNSEYTKFSCHFPESGANTVHQSGRALSKWSKGLTVNIYQRKGAPAPHSFEFYSDNEYEYAEGGLWFESTNNGTKLTDYDGVFNLPKEVVVMLKALGLNTEYID